MLAPKYDDYFRLVEAHRRHIKGRWGPRWLWGLDKSSRVEIRSKRPPRDSPDSSTAGSQVQCLVGELRSRKPRGVTKQTEAKPAPCAPAQRLVMRRWAPSWWGTVTPPADVLDRDINVRGGLTSVPEASRPFLARSTSGVHPTPPCAAPTAPQNPGVRVAGSCKAPLLSSLTTCVPITKMMAWEEAGWSKEDAGLDTGADKARWPASLLWPSRASEFWGWSFTRENGVYRIPLHFAPAFHDLHGSSLFTRTLWGTAWFLEWPSLICERTCVWLNGVSTCCAYVWRRNCWTCCWVAWRGASFSWGDPLDRQVCSPSEEAGLVQGDRKCFREANVIKPSVCCCCLYLDIKRIFVNESVFESEHSKKTFPPSFQFSTRLRSSFACFYSGLSTTC